MVSYVSVADLIMSSKKITPDTCETSLFEKKSVHRCNQVKVRSYWNRVGPESNDWCPYKRKEKKMWTHRCMGKKTM